MADLPRGFSGGSDLWDGPLGNSVFFEEFVTDIPTYVGPVSYVTSLLSDYPDPPRSNPFVFDSGTTGWSSVLAGDIILFSVTVDDNTSTATPPSGAVALSALAPSGDGSYTVSAGLYAWEVPSPKPSSMSFDFGTTRRGSMSGIVYRKSDVDKVWNYSALAATPLWTDNGPTSKAIPRITTVGAESAIATWVSQGSGSAVITAPAGWTVRTNSGQRDGAAITRDSYQITPGQISAANLTVKDTQMHFMVTTAVWSSVPPLQATVISEAWSGASGDVADGVAIIPNLSSPEDSVWIGTNKSDTGGLAVYNMAGEILSTVTGFAANSVDWRDTTGLSGWDGRILVMTSDRVSGSFGLRFYWFDRTTKALTFANQVNLGYEPYGTGLGIRGTTLYALVSDRGPDNTSARNIYEHALTRSTNTVSIGAAVRTFNAPNVVEGMVHDDVNELWYLSQEDVALTSLDSSATTWADRVNLDTVGAGNLIADVEDVAVINGPTPRVIVSSQGDSSYHVYGRNGSAWAHEKRFNIARPGGSGLVSDTDGLDIHIGNLGSDFPYGALIVHDATQDPSRFVMLPVEEIWPELIEERLPRYVGFAALTSLWKGPSTISSKYVGT